MSTTGKLRVAVIGSGGSGLAAAREYLANGFEVKVFEQGYKVGGQWVGQDPTKPAEHAHLSSAVYDNLITNLPKALMHFSDFLFPDDCPEFLAPPQMLVYLEAFADKFDLRRHIALHTRVENVRLVPATASTAVTDKPLAERESKFLSADSSADDVTISGLSRAGMGAASSSAKTAAIGDAKTLFEVRFSFPSAIRDAGFGSAGAASAGSKERKESKSPASPSSPSTAGGRETRAELFDAVCVCNGHYSVPRMPSVPGMQQSQCHIMHCQRYRSPTDALFKGKRVIVVGAHHSGVDIAGELRTSISCNSLRLSMRQTDTHKRNAQFIAAIQAMAGKDPELDLIDKRPEIVSFGKGKRVNFVDGTHEEADTVIYCTGYQYAFPFLEPPLRPSTANERVHPIYRHIFHIPLGARLTFIGLPFRIIPFPIFELQSRWAAKALAGKVPLPSPADMLADTQQFYKQLATQGIADHFTHQVDSLPYAWTLIQACEKDLTDPCVYEMVEGQLTKRLRDKKDKVSGGGERKDEARSSL